ncbi:MAG: acyl-CoA thioesterase [Spirochaetales bacterium]|nr:acyl-CoA thioesterase [Spirochaetales bacterium]
MSTPSPAAPSGDAQAPFQTSFPVRIGDINYGGHVGNERFLSLFHDARLQFLASLGGSEMDIGEGVALIMSEARVRYRSEAFYGDTLTVQVRAGEIKDVRFTLEYKVFKNDTSTVVATGTTVLVGFDYQKRRVCRLPEGFVSRLR